MDEAPEIEVDQNGESSNSNTISGEWSENGVPEEADNVKTRSQHEREGSSLQQNVYGFENEVMSLEKMLQRRQSDDQFMAIGIVGVQGVGKSTLCRALVNKIKTKFLPRIWVSMDIETNDSNEDGDSRKALVISMLECLGVEKEIIGSIGSEHGLHGLLYALHLQLHGKRYLVVLDGAWDSDKWYELLDSQITRSKKWDELLAYGFPKGYGGTVIVTSRSKEVAKKMIGSEKNLHHLLPLSEEESCWSIFRDAVVRAKKKFVDPPDSELEKEKKVLFLKCRGLPFAAKMMGEIASEQLPEE
ncbi:hypothetical protein CJ030_MR4G021344 [Morella rubra]|uniref:NB-ARC domain-containing protein n=1 Tax=Morella rubra TaxID=262757 RepID=A0A6A1VFG4_9ROSI|nr:hypothetical protein CJ030_MR6G021349 [Morella rubra]KAB1216977.1 hypothetical protein CJ030_MR4G021344 [Morella rubra]